MKTYPDKRANKTWILSESIDSTSNEALLAYSPLVRQVLFNRGVHDAAEAELFLNPSDKLIGPFNQMPDMYTLIGLALIVAGVLIVNLLGKAN